VQRTIELGRTGIAIAPLGVGTWAWGDRRVWGFDPEEGPRRAEAAFAASMARGLTFFDTAEIYGSGLSEELLGRFVRNHTASEDGAPAPLVATKYAPLPQRMRARSLTEALERSRARLGVAVDLYQIHWPYAFTPLGALLDRLADAVHSGRVRAVGVSNFGADATRRAHDHLARRGVVLATNQIPLSLLDRGVDRRGVMAACAERGVTVLAYSPLAMGALTGKYGPGRPPQGAFRRHRAVFRRLARADELVRLLDEISRRHGASPSQISLAWLLHRDGVVPIPGARDAHQAEENAGALQVVLDEDEQDALDRASLAAG
jgi:aryl-alcohol dehydrogenase-like predicted oxidoreductase